MINYKLAGLISVILGIWALFSDAYDLLFVMANALGYPYVLLNLRDLIITRFQFNKFFLIVFNFVIASFLIGPLVVLLPLYIGGPLVLVIRGFGYLVLGYFLLTRWYQLSALLRCLSGVILVLGIAHLHSAIWAFYPRSLLVFSVEGLKVFGAIRALFQLAMYVLLGAILLRAPHVQTKESALVP